MAEMKLNKHVHILLGVIVIMLSVLSNNARAKGPDFSKLTEHVFDLSKIALRLQLPGKLDREFPVEAGSYQVNIYDPELQDKGKLLERHWDYRGYLWQGQYALMSLIISLEKLPSDADIDIQNKITDLQGVIENDIYGVYRKRNQELVTDPNIAQANHEVKLVFDENTLSNTNALQCIQTDNHSKGTTRTTYYISISDEHFLAFQFKMVPLESGREHPDKWVKQANRDMSKVVNSIVISYP